MRCTHRACSLIFTKQNRGDTANGIIFWKIKLWPREDGSCQGHTERANAAQRWRWFASQPRGPVCFPGDGREASQANAKHRSQGCRQVPSSQYPGTLRGYGGPEGGGRVGRSTQDRPPLEQEELTLKDPLESHKEVPVPRVPRPQRAVTSSSARGHSRTCPGQP